MDVAMNVGQNVQTLNLSAKYEKQLLHFDLAKVEKGKIVFHSSFVPILFSVALKIFHSPRSAFISQPFDANKD